jgi:cellulose synthase/poly-beta-1,6-N-acetylglucosamine synthase-like glycosyltransferase
VQYAADAVIYTEAPSDWNGLFNQRLRWKFGRLQAFYLYRRLFFSADPKHNKYLSFVVLPIALFAETLLLFEGFLLTAFFWYVLASHDYLPLLAVIGLLTGIVCMQVLTDPKARHHSNLLLLAPGTWILFYVLDAIEFQALVRSLYRIATKQNPTWQRWTRIGITV